MPTIRKTNSNRISIADAKRLILEAAPLEPMGHVYAQLDEHGNIDEDAPIDVRFVQNTNTFEMGIDRDFLDACNQLNIHPRNKYRPAFTDYSGDCKQDDYYTITHDEFERYAGLHDMRVVVNPSPTAAPDTDAQPQAATEVPAAPASETTEQRRARWLDWYGKGEHGAVQRVFERERLQNPKADRSFIGKEIKKAKGERATKKRSDTMVGQLVRDGKRVG